LGERTVWLDCDVLQATAERAVLRSRVPTSRPTAPRALRSRPRADRLGRRGLGGIVEGEKLLDLDYGEDSSAEVDMNYVTTGDGRLIELQATAETVPFAREELDELLALAASGAETIKAAQEEALKAAESPPAARA